jgi:hypothetical protein
MSTEIKGSLDYSNNIYKNNALKKINYNNKYNVVLMTRRPILNIVTPFIKIHLLIVLLLIV